MTETQRDNRHATLTAAATRTASRYSIARGARSDRGERIESRAEGRARIARDDARTALRQFEAEHGTPAN